MRLTQHVDSKIDWISKIVCLAWLGTRLPDKPTVDVFELGLITKELAQSIQYILSTRTAFTAAFFDSWEPVIRARAASNLQNLEVDCTMLLPPMRLRLTGALPEPVLCYIDAAEPIQEQAKQMSGAIKSVQAQCTTVQQFFHAIPPLRHFFPADFIAEPKRTPRVSEKARAIVAETNINEALAPLLLLPSIEEYAQKGKAIFRFTDTALIALNQENTNV